MYLKSRMVGPDDGNNAACANCADLVKVTYDEMDRRGHTGAWHCRHDLSDTGYRHGKYQQPWSFTCGEFVDRVDESVDEKSGRKAKKNRMLDLIPECEAVLL